MLVSKTYDAIRPALRVAARTMGYDKVVVRNAFVEYDLNKGKDSHQDVYLCHGIRVASNVHRRRDLSWAARLFAQVRPGTHANAG
jgi:hypothetical protein